MVSGASAVLRLNVRIRQKAFDARDAVREKHVGDTDSDDQ